MLTCSQVDLYNLSVLLLQSKWCNGMPLSSDSVLGNIKQACSPHFLLRTVLHTLWPSCIGVLLEALANDEGRGGAAVFTLTCT